VARATKAPVDIHAMRIEDLAQSANRLAPDVVSARALAPLPRLFDLAAPFFAAGTRGLFLKGREAEAEVEAAKAEWDFTARLVPSPTGANSHTVEATNLPPRAERGPRSGRASWAPANAPACSRSPTRRAASARPRPPSISAPRSQRSASACSSSTSTRRAT